MLHELEAADKVVLALGKRVHDELREREDPRERFLERKSFFKFKYRIHAPLVERKLRDDDAKFLVVLHLNRRVVVVFEVALELSAELAHEDLVVLVAEAFLVEKIRTENSAIVNTADLWSTHNSS